MSGEFGLHTGSISEAMARATAEYLAPDLPLWQESLAGWEWLALRSSTSTARAPHAAAAA